MRINNENILKYIQNPKEEEIYEALKRDKRALKYINYQNKNRYFLSELIFIIEDIQCPQRQSSIRHGKIENLVKKLDLYKKNTLFS